MQPGSIKGGLEPEYGICSVTRGRTFLRYAVFAVTGYFLAFVFMVLLFGVLEISGWYVVYVPFIAVLGSVVALFFVNLDQKENSE